jgi:hypothetical protein
LPNTRKCFLIAFINRHHDDRLRKCPSTSRGQIAPVHVKRLRRFIPDAIRNRIGRQSGSTPVPVVVSERKIFVVKMGVPVSIIDRIEKTKWTAAFLPTPKKIMIFWVNTTRSHVRV